MKRTLKCILAAIIAAQSLLPTLVSAAADDRESVTVFERYTENSDGFYIENNIAYMPVRSLAALCADDAYVAWNEKKRAVTVSSENSDFTMTDGSDSVLSRWNTETLRSAPRVRNGRMYVPVRETARLFGYDAAWDNEDRSITLDKIGKSDAEDSENTLLWLARIIFAEARGEPTEGKIAVGNVVLERAASEDFPDTVYGVIFDRDPVVQFTPLANFTLFNIPDEECIDAARRVLNGDKAVEGCLYFVNPVTTSSDWVMKNREFVVMIGNHAFYK